MDFHLVKQVLQVYLWGDMVIPPWAQIATTGEWNDTSWTAGGNLNTARDSGGFSVYGVVTQAMIVAGRVPPPNLSTL